MRLRERDLYELYMILKSVKNIKLQVSYTTSDIQHPHPTNNERYNRVKNYGTFDKPKIKIESAGFPEVESVNKTTPTHLLKSTLNKK